MTKKITIIILFISIFGVIVSLTSNFVTVKADKLSESVEEQLSNIDLTEIENYFNALENKPDKNYFELLITLLSGEYNLNFNTFFNYLLNIFFGQIIKTLPVFLSVIAIAIFCGITQGFKNSFLSESVSDIIFLVCFLSVVLILFTGILEIYENSKNTIENISKLTEIMSPILLTLMIASGATVSASVYKPTVVFLSIGTINIFLNIVIPLIGIMLAFSVVTNLSTSIKLNKYTDFACSIIKWVFGLTVITFTVLITVNGLSSASHDGISIRAAKFAITNSIPIVGGFIKDSFDFILAGSVLIKNSIGITAIFILFYIILSPIICIAVFSLLLKLTSAITENIADTRISNFCTSLSRCVSYLCASIVMVSFMFFIMIVLMILSGNAFL